MTEERIYYEGVKQAENALFTNGAQEDCGSTWNKLMETNAFFIMSATINAPLSLILLFWAENDSPSN